MAETKTIKTRIQMKADTAENWSKAEGFTPLLREPVFYTDSGAIKFGDGQTNVNDLPIFNLDKITASDAINTASGLDETPGIVFEKINSDGKEAYQVTGYTGDSDELIIPKIHKGLPVVKICANTIPLYSLGEYVWNEEYQGSDWVENPDYTRVMKIKKIVIPETVTLIEVGAFNGLCNYAAEYDNTNTLIGGQIEHITLPFIGIYKDAKELNSYLGAIFGITGTGSSQPDGDWPYWWDGEYYEQTGMDSCYAIHTPKSLKTVTILDSVNSLSGYQFMGCPNLTSIYIHKPQDYKNINFIDINNSSNAPNAKVYYDLVTVDAIENKLSNKNTIVDFKGEVAELPADTSTYQEGNIILVTSGANAGREYILSNGVWVEFGKADEDPNCAYFTFTLQTDGTYKISAYTGTATTLSIPMFYKGIPVTTIGSSTFKDKTTLTNVTIPTTITKIDTSAFSGCTSLTEIIIPDSVTTLSNAFLDCTSLKRAVIGKGDTALTAIFKGCTALTEVILPEGLISVAGTFNGCSSLTNITLPESVTTIGTGAFRECTALTSIILPKNISTVHKTAFTNSGVTDVYCCWPEGQVAITEERWGLAETAVIHYDQQTATVSSYNALAERVENLDLGTLAKKDKVGRTDFSDDTFKFTSGATVGLCDIKVGDYVSAIDFSNVPYLDSIPSAVYGTENWNYPNITFDDGTRITMVPTNESEIIAYTTSDMTTNDLDVGTADWFSRYILAGPRDADGGDNICKSIAVNKSVTQISISTSGSSTAAPMPESPDENPVVYYVPSSSTSSELVVHSKDFKITVGAENKVEVGVNQIITNAGIVPTIDTSNANESGVNFVIYENGVFKAVQVAAGGSF